MRVVATIMGIAWFLVTSGAAFATPPNALSYQGLLRDASGVPLVGPVDLEIGIWDDVAAGAALYRESHTAVILTEGAFHVRIGTGTVLEGTLDASTFSGAERFLEIGVSGETLSPRQAISSAPYALRATHADLADMAEYADMADHAVLADWATAAMYLSALPTIVTGPTATAGANGGFATSVATCPTGLYVTGGGVRSGTNGLNTRRNYPSSATTWDATMHNNHSSPRTFHAYAICVRAANF